MIEPIIMDFKSESWEHPDISTLAFNFTMPSEINEGCFDGQLARIVLESNSELLNIVAIVEEEFYLKLCNDELSKDDLEEFAQYIFVTLFEDVWSPGEQFCFTDFGKSISHFSKKFEYTVSPDVCIHYDGPGEGWGWST